MPLTPEQQAALSKERGRAAVFLPIADRPAFISAQGQSEAQEGGMSDSEASHLRREAEDTIATEGKNRIVGAKSGGTIQSYDKGTDYVPEDGPAFLHTGEMVVPKADADQLRATKEYDTNQPLHTPGGVIPAITSGDKATGAGGSEAAAEDLFKKNLISSKVLHDTGKAEYQAALPKITAKPSDNFGIDYHQQLADQQAFKSSHPYGSAVSAHPGILGKIMHGLATAGNIAGDVFAPSTMALIPGTNLHNRVDRIENEADVTAGLARKEQAAQTNDLDAQAQLRRHPIQKPGNTPEEQAIFDLMHGENGSPRVNPATNQPYSLLEAYEKVKQTGQDTKAPKVDFQHLDNGDIVKLLTNDKGATTSEVVYHGAPKQETDVQKVMVTGADGTKVEHSVLIDKRTGKQIKDLGETGMSEQPGSVSVGQRYGIVPGDTGAQVMQKIEAVDPATAAALHNVINYKAPLSPTFAANPRKGSNQLSQADASGLISMIEPTWRADQFKIIEGVRKDFTSGKTSGNITGLLQGVHHLDALRTSVHSQTGVGIPIFNKGIQGTQEALGFEGALGSKFDIVAVSGELANIFKQSGATDDEINAWKADIKPNMTNKQIDKVVREGMKLLSGRLAVQAQKYNIGAGRPYDFKLVDPGTVELLKQLPGGDEVLKVMNVSSAGAGSGFDHTKFPKAP